MARPAHSVHVRLRRSLAGARRLRRQYKADQEAISPGTTVRSHRIGPGRHKGDLSSRRSGFELPGVSGKSANLIGNREFGRVPFNSDGFSKEFPGGSGLAPTGLPKKVFIRSVL